MKTTEPSKGEIVIYKAKDGKASLEIKLEKDTVWLSQKQMAELFEVKIPAISKHINNIYEDKELSKTSTVSILETVQNEGKREVLREVEHYNLDIAIAVGYRVNSKKATQFRVWATQVLKEHIIKGYTLNPKRLPEANLKELEEAINLIKSTLVSKELTNDESKGLLKVITDYANSWILLQKYDSNKLEEPKKKHKPKHELTYDKAIEAITKLKADLKSKKEASDLFGNERDLSFEGIIGNVYQTLIVKTFIQA